MKPSNALPHISSIRPYPPGKPISAVAREFGLDPEKIIKLASNENPLGVSDLVKDVLNQGMEEVSYYPDFYCHNLRTALAKQNNVSPTEILPGAGSSDLIMLVARAYLSHERNVVIPEYSFASYEGAARSVGAEVIMVKSPDHKIDLDGVLNAITEMTGVVYLATPNNPTGHALTPKSVSKFIAAVPEHVMVVLDEAYREFLPEDERVNLSEVRSLRENLLVLRTFSKIYGLAGLRVGYGVASEETLSILKRIQLPFSVGTLSEAAAVAALQDQDFVKKCRDLNTLERQRMYDFFDKNNFRYVNSKGNFVLLEVGKGADVSKALLQRGIIVRPVDNYGLPTWLRVSVGLPEHNTAFMENLAEILPKGF